MRNCRNCYYRSIIGFESWCCHPAIGKRIKHTDKKCADHIYFDDKYSEFAPKTPYAEMIKKRVNPPARTYRLTHAGTAIECKKCGMVSFLPDDIMQKYCGNCKIFHGEP